MAQHDYNIADQPGLAFLADLNSALEAAATLNSGATEPTTTYAGMLWLDTSTTPPVLKQRNQANNGWDTLSSLLDAEIMPSPTAGGYRRRKADNTGDETRTPQQVADELAPLIVAPGAILAFAANSAPTGFLKCNGAAVSRTTYAALFAAIGTTFGDGDGVNTFNLPDLRGEFIRGWDDGRGVDAGRVLGSAQDGSWIRTVAQEWAGSDIADGGLYAQGVSYAGEDGRIVNAGAGGAVPAGAKSPGGMTFDASTTDNVSLGSAVIRPGEAVNNWIRLRPRNVALLYCIKY